MTKNKKSADELNVYILLDRSGSMHGKWEETLSSVNAYVSELKKDKAKGEVTVATFDDHIGVQFDIIRKAVPFKEYEKITNKEASPRGGTPLYDCLSRIVHLANLKNAEKTVIVVMTDGHENASKEVNAVGAKALVASCKSRDWEVVFLGADFDASNQAAAVGVNWNQTINVTAGCYASAMRGLATKSLNYGVTGQTMAFSAEDRDEAQGKKTPTA